MLTFSKINVYLALSMVAGVLMVIAAAGGLLIADVYRDSAVLVPVLRGQDLVTLLAAPLLIWAAFATWRGSTRGALIWIGLTGYMLYTYTGAAFAYTFNIFFPLYVLLFSLAIFTLIGALANINVEQLRSTFDSGTPRKPVAIFLLLIGLVLGFGEIAQIVPFYTTGTLPEPLEHFGVTTYFVYVLDLGVIVPLMILASVWLWRGMGWGYLLAGCLLIKSATMGLALLSMTWFALQAGQPDDGLTVLWIVIAFGSFGLGIWFFGHCHDESVPRESYSVKAERPVTPQRQNKNRKQANWSSIP